MDPNFADQSQKENIGIVKFDIYTMEPSDSAGSAAAGAAGGLVGALVYTAIKDAQNQKDFSVDTEAVRLHDESVARLVTELEASELVQPVEITSRQDSDPVATSRNIRKSRLYGFDAPTTEEVDEFIKGHGLDYALYSAHFGGDRPGGGVFLSSKWKIYDKEADEVVSVLTRSVDAEASRKTLTPTTLTDRYLLLFDDNMRKFLSAAKTTSPKANRDPQRATTRQFDRSTETIAATVPQNKIAGEGSEGRAEAAIAF